MISLKKKIVKKKSTCKKNIWQKNKWKHTHTHTAKHQFTCTKRHTQKIYAQKINNKWKHKYMQKKYICAKINQNIHTYKQTRKRKQNKQNKTSKLCIPPNTTKVACIKRHTKTHARAREKKNICAKNLWEKKQAKTKQSKHKLPVHVHIPWLSYQYVSFCTER